MRSYATILGLMAMLLMSASRAPAPIFGLFDGYQEMSKRADEIAVATVSPQTSSDAGHDMGMYHQREIQIVSLVKGTLKHGQTHPIGVRFLPQADCLPNQETERMASPTTGTLCLLFMTRTPPFSQGGVTGFPGVDLYTMNQQGSMLRLPTDFYCLSFKSQVDVDSLLRQILTTYLSAQAVALTTKETSEALECLWTNGRTAPR